MRTNVIACAIFVLVAATESYSQIFLDVRVGGSSAQDDPPGQGDDWGSAYLHLQDGLVQAEFLAQNNPSSTVRVWVANSGGGHPYRPDQGDGQVVGDQNASFILRDRVRLLGGFVGDEIDATERDPVSNETILTGCIDPAGCPTDPLCDGIDRELRSYHVLRSNGGDADAVVDGLTITQGEADGADPNDRGAALISETFNVSPSPWLVRCSFVANCANQKGAGLFLSRVLGGTVQPTRIVNCRFVNQMPGGAVYVEGSTKAELTNCQVDSNSGVGAVLVAEGVFGSPVLTLTNCTVVDNAATSAVVVVSGSSAAAEINSSILWFNTPNQILVQNGGTVVAQYSNIQGGFGMPADMNIDQDPLFADRDGPDNDVSTWQDNNYRLTLNSPCVNGGNPAIGIIESDVFDLDQDDSNSEPTPDLDLRDRIFGSSVDMGAYECRESGVCVGDLNGDGMTAINDLLVLLGEWETSGPHAADIAPGCGDGNVNILDLLALLGDWDCPEFAESTPSSVMDCFSQYSDPIDQATCIEGLIKSGQY